MFINENSYLNILKKSGKNDKIKDKESQSQKCVIRNKEVKIVARISNVIEEFIKNLINDTDNGIVEIQRNELANKFECAPSQINYVLTTRFTSEKGYYIESRRGGGGYIKIFKTNINNDDHISNMIANMVGDALTNEQCISIINEFVVEEVITKREGNIMRAAINDRSLQGCESDKEVRANIFKNMLLILTNGGDLK